jgi:hypothetical protein
MTREGFLKKETCMFPRLIPRGRLEENKDEAKQRVKIN